jgi:23S rRNA (cytidine1920-2'-O)/16S rRNA (cytidine1409-2'-O)-methyltransferase
VKERADKVLVDQGLTSSRSQAKSLIEQGKVSCQGQLVKKAGELIPSDATISIAAQLYVGRGAFKLAAALSAFSIETSGKVFIDVGASTGGFTEVLLQQGVARVYAVDVGHGQLSAKLLSDPRVINLENTNIKELQSLPEPIDGAVMDLSFISILKVVDQLKQLLRPGAQLVALIKPQFEAGPERIPKDGVIKDPTLQQQIHDEVVTAMLSKGWLHHQSIPSPIEGKSGNKEFLGWFSFKG